MKMPLATMKQKSSELLLILFVWVRFPIIDRVKVVKQKWIFSQATFCETYLFQNRYNKSIVLNKDSPFLPNTSKLANTVECPHRAFK